MDLDEDGAPDILSGSYSRTGGQPMAGLFQVVRGDPSGGFASAEALKGTDGKPLIIPNAGEEERVKAICTRPTAVDWDGYGSLDLVVGNFEGTFYCFTGKGGGRFEPEPHLLETTEGEALELPGTQRHGDPFVVDWDGDGDLDIVSGSSGGGVYWSENSTGEGGRPRPSAFRALVEPCEHPQLGDIVREEELARPSQSARVWVCDPNGDGKLDLLVGDQATLMGPVEGVSIEAYGEKAAAWSERMREVSTAASEAKPEERDSARERYMEVWQSRDEFMVEDRTGYVWYFQRK